MEYASLLIVALVIAKECLAPEIVFAEEIEQSKYLPKFIRHEIGSPLFDDSDQLQKALITYMNSKAVFLEQTYKEIFYETSSPLAFWDHFKAAECWKKLQ